MMQYGAVAEAQFSIICQEVPQAFVQNRSKRRRALLARAQPSLAAIMPRWLYVNYQ